MVAAAGGHLSMVERFLERGADPIPKNIGGEVALMRAASGGYLPVVERLLEFVADPGHRGVMVARS